MKNPPTRRQRNPLFLVWIAASLNLTACAQPSWGEYSSLIDEQPFVLEVLPTDGSRIEMHSEFVLRFSERIDFASFENEAVVLLHNAGEESFSDVGDFQDDLESGELATVPLQFVLDAEEKELSLLPEKPLADGLYHLVITPALLSVQGLPFNQEPGESPRLFIARYRVGEGELPQLGESPSGPEGTPPPIFGPAPETLVIHEFLYDGKVSETDGEAFVELYGSAGADISLYQVIFVNGDNGEETERITLPPNSILGDDGIFLIADLKTSSTTVSGVLGADFMDQFDPQNGPDGLQLLNREGELLDSIVYGEGAAGTATNGLALGEGSPAPDVGGGHSLSRLAGIDSGDNFSDFQDQAAPSPGSP